MELTAILCNHAEAQNNLLYVAGGGIDRAIIPAGRSEPYTVSVGLGIIIEVPWTATNQEHAVDVRLEDADGHPVEVETGSDEHEPFRTQFRFNVGRPRHLEPGETQSVAFAINIPVLRLEKLGTYVFTISVDDTVLRRLHYRLVGQTGVTITTN
ncbi:hypothetical protein OQ968_23680 [Mycobacterium sp. 663a-19]|uniref:DUF6941 family protein n=1 Tax=Mycobacterium sp. 663a-19 TaxID=2986148 RepID=UPI002D1EDEDB|nr:hypothetical protein [Mycobacterium sp. 663a-19]MEB3984250.1 hypothetical protein [Mycobacterium sp. 663a-19]